MLIWRAAAPALGKAQTKTGRTRLESRLLPARSGTGGSRIQRDESVRSFRSFSNLVQVEHMRVPVISEVGTSVRASFVRIDLADPRNIPPLYDEIGLYACAKQRGGANNGISGRRGIAGPGSAGQDLRGAGTQTHGHRQDQKRWLHGFPFLPLCFLALGGFSVSRVTGMSACE